MNKRFIPIASNLMPSIAQQKLIDLYNPIFDKYELVQSSQPIQGSENYFFIMTGGTENMFLQYLNKLDKSELIKIIAIGINNSLPASLEILAYAYQNGMEGNIYYLKDEKDFDALSD